MKAAPAVRTTVVHVIVALAVAGVALLRASGPPQADSDWRAPGLAAFDEAWSVINDTFYDPAFGGLDWAALKTELRPRVATAESPDAQREVIRELLGKLGQSHFELLSASETGGQLGPAVVAIDVRALSDGMAITDVEPGSAAAAAGLVRGMRLLAVDDRRLDNSTAGGADEPRRGMRQWEVAYRALRGNDGAIARLDVQDAAGVARTIEVARERPTGDIVTLGDMPALRVRLDARTATTPAGRSAGVIRFSLWMPIIDAPFSAAVDANRQSAGLVIDLRGNPGGLADMIRGIAGHVLDEPALIGKIHLRATELELRANPRRATSDGRAVKPFAGPVAILVDELSASASECFAAGLQSLGRARVFGSRTTGQALPASTRRLSNGDMLMYAVGDFVTSRGTRVEGTGVTPDVRVPLSWSALQTGVDPVLQAALAWIDSAK